MGGPRSLDAPTSESAAGKGQVQLGADLRDRPILPALAVAGVHHERARQHAVDIEAPVQVVDLVLEDAGVPAARLDLDRLGALVQAGDPDGGVPGRQRPEAGDAQAALEEEARSVVE